MEQLDRYCASQRACEVCGALRRVHDGRLTANGSAFELWDLFVRLRSFVWTGQTVRWQKLAKELCRLLDLRERLDPNSSREARQARCKLIDLISYLNSNLESLIDYRTRQRVGLRIATGFVESSIN
ncbi:hypothetical protein CS8_025700 [Cupriavidus sp. 8B]